MIAGKSRFLYKLNRWIINSLGGESLLLSKRFVTVLLIFIINPFLNSNSLASTLFSGRELSRGGSLSLIPFDTTLDFSTTGTLTLKNSRGMVMYTFAENADVAAMHTDGNFVVYRHPGIVLFHTGTSGNPGATLDVISGGNVHVMSSSRWPLWSLSSSFDPTFGMRSGDVLGRDMTEPVVSVLGHLGIFDGGGVYQAAPPVNGSNAISALSAFDFKNSTNSSGATVPYWGEARYNIPPGTISIYGCFSLDCPLPNQSATADSRTSISRRVQQIQLLGADYTVGAEFTRAFPSWNGQPRIRGRYRCDTFILDAIQHSANYVTFDSQKRTWKSRLESLLAPEFPRTPGTIFNALYNFK